MSEFVLRAFDRGSEKNLGVTTIHGVSQTLLRELVGADDDDPMLDAFPVDGPALERLARLMGIEVEPEDALYFVEYHGA